MTGPTGHADLRLHPSGRGAILVECATLDGVLALHRALAATRPKGVVELVPAARTVLVVLDPDVLALESAAAWIRRTGASAAAAAGDPTPSEAPMAGDGAAVVVVDVDYRGDDLADLADAIGVSPERLVARHAATTWRVAFTGFAPGFGYLVAEDWPFDVPRLDVARTRVPAGAVGLAGAFSGVYPRESPGGWRLVGRTDATLWDPAADPPALLAPGRVVRFREVAP